MINNTKTQPSCKNSIMQQQLKMLSTRVHTHTHKITSEASGAEEEEGGRGKQSSEAT